MNKKKKPNVILYTIFMIIIFWGITNLGIWGYGSNTLIDAITEYPKGTLVLNEAVLASLVLIIMLLFKNSYVFTQAHEKFSKGLFYGLFYIIGSIIFVLMFGVMAPFKFNPFVILNLTIGCFLIGVAEEFLCRGWLLNEFLERYGDSKKGVWFSIIISGIIFGLMHLGNIYTMGQDIPSTISQALSAAGTGIFLGLIYYKTKNIWSVIFLHGFWDFSIFLSDISPVQSTTEIFTTLSVVSLVFTILSFFAELLNLIPYIKDIDEEPKKSSIIIFAIVGIILSLVFSFVSGLFISEHGEVYKFDSINIEKYSLTTDCYDEYFINYERYINSEDIENSTNEKYSFKLSKNDKDNLVFTNLNTNYSVEIECESLYDYIIMEEKDYYVLAYVDYTNSANPFLKYNYIYKNSLSNENSFVDGIKNNYKKYLLSERSELMILHDRENNISYVDAYDPDYGDYLLVSEDKMSILNRDK